MNKNCLEAFSDGVVAIIITIMVLELKPPHDASPAALLKLLPIFLSYVLSFIFVAIYWNNHHHTFHACRRVNGAVLWANLHLLFWLSLVPFTTAWMGENHFSQWTVFVYGLNLLMCAIAYTIMIRALIALEGPESTLAHAIGKDSKGYVSLALYLAGLVLLFVHPYLGMACYVAVALIWLVPDSRIARLLSQEH